jgi:hypothetical protein
MEDNRPLNSSNGAKRRRSALVVLLAVFALAATGVAGIVLGGHRDTATTRPAIGSPQSQATAGSSVESPDPGKSSNPQQPPGNQGNPGQPGKPGKLPPVDQLPPPPFPPPGLPKPPFPKPIPPLVFKQP